MAIWVLRSIDKQTNRNKKYLIKTPYLVDRNGVMLQLKHLKMDYLLETLRSYRAMLLGSKEYIQNHLHSL